MKIGEKERERACARVEIELRRRAFARVNVQSTSELPGNCFARVQLHKSFPFLIFRVTRDSAFAVTPSVSGDTYHFEQVEGETRGHRGEFHEILRDIDSLLTSGAPH